MGSCNIWVFFVLTVFSHALAYTPAQPINGSVEGTGTNRLTLQWYSNGSDTEFVYYLLAGTNSDGLSQGPLVHFSEDIAGYGTTTTTPWIAFISCDTNSTNATQELDIFTLARDRGAQAALLYSLFSDSCAINPAYTDPDNFERVFDLFATESARVSKFIEYEFNLFGANGTYYGTYNATMLNETASAVNRSIALGSPITPGMIFATLQSFNATAAPNNGSLNTGGTASTTSSSGSDSQKTGLAMIILYAITGCVSALFCLVIISGAIRAIRHPDRYGPRMPEHGGVGDPGQSRARGLGRAMLDTFPVVKFGSTSDPVSRTKDVEEPPHVESAEAPISRHSDSVELGEVIGNPGNLSEERDIGGSGGNPDQAGSEEEVMPTPRLRSTAETAQQSTNTSGVTPEAIGRETCPICIMGFEEGDDLRVLPCEGKHRFHQACVDPWLLELSGSCPLCRQDFHALEAILTGEPRSDEPDTFRRHSQALSVGSAHNRFSRYLRFARGRQQGSPSNPERVAETSGTPSTPSS
ncbi:hypothetical protein EDC04DRAFT_2678336 [Pisolithus marmoratus]|nr:hypothetical protein EDC04DRAFT_2678336 [Pisolithus marmoratus]